MKGVLGGQVVRMASCFGEGKEKEEGGARSGRETDWWGELERRSGLLGSSQPWKEGVFALRGVLFGAMVDDTLSGSAEDAEVMHLVLDNEELLGLILGNLESSELMKMAMVNSMWRRVARDKRLWRQKCQSLWDSKQHVSERVTKGDFEDWKKFHLSIMDSRRTCPTTDEMSSCIWMFRFKGTRSDLVESSATFRGDGTMRIASNREMKWTIHHSGLASTHNTSQLEKYQSWRNVFPDDSFLCPILEQHRQDSSVLVLDKSVPLRITRTENWGWKLENEWVVFESQFFS